MKFPYRRVGRLGALAGAALFLVGCVQAGPNSFSLPTPKLPGAVEPLSTLTPDQQSAEVAGAWQNVAPPK